MTRPTRRAVLASVGVVVSGGLAGCNLGSDEDDEDSPRFEPEEIEPVLSEPTPEVRRPVPVEPAASAVEDGLSRVDDLVESVPASLSAADVPNGAAREEIASTREQALSDREDVENARDRFRALEVLPRARRTAREAATALAAVDDGDVVSAIRDEREAVRIRVGTRLVELDYAGADLGRTLLLGYRLEDWLTSARRRATRAIGPDEPDALDVGQLAGALESAAATADAADHLVARHAATVDDATDFRTRFATALEASMRSADRADLPTAETSAEEWLGREIDHRPVEHLLQACIRSVRDRDERLHEEWTEDRLGTGLARAYDFERDVRAFEVAAERVVDGEFGALESTDQIRAEREAALEAAEAVPVDPTQPSLAADTFARTLDGVRLTDGGVERYLERDRDARLTREYAQYAFHRAQLEVLPEAVETMRSRLDRQ